MALSGLDIYKLLPKTNCRECGFATCLAFAMQLAKKVVSLEKCPFVSEEAKKILEASSQLPIKLITLGVGDDKLEIGNEAVLFRHEEKFHHPCGIGFIIDDNLKDIQISERLNKIKQLNFERVGQELKVNLVAIRSNSDEKSFVAAVKLVLNSTSLPIALMSNNALILRPALELVKDKKVLIYQANKNNFKELAQLALEFKAVLAVQDADLVGLSELTQEISKIAPVDLLLDTGKKLISEKIWDLTQLRRQALKKSNRSLGYPSVVVIEEDDPYEEAIEAATYISKYAGLVLIKGVEAWQSLSLLTLRQNIFTDPQKPLQIEPKLYPVGHAGKSSPVLVTTNFSLSYYTVLSEVEASKVPAYILSIDTEGMSVLTAWAAEKFTPGKISDSLNQFGVEDMVSHKNLIIPGYVAMISGELEETSGWKITVGPKEAAGLPSFLKNLS
ncbi:MAG: acetyl-CoA decarbonylase/synthase complex subunit gamma [Candidatus Omnitrophica bacterium]|nr:acetyl-CoA decarbonylase/synthase complex subunit gamma [Candidatus Omnitrophota bacterium]